MWMWTRMVVARAWTAAHEIPCIFGGAVKGAQRAAWAAAFAAESAATNESINPDSPFCWDSQSRCAFLPVLFFRSHTPVLPRRPVSTDIPHQPSQL